MQQRPGWAQGATSPSLAEPPVSAPARLDRPEARAAPPLVTEDLAPPPPVVPAPPAAEMESRMTSSLVTGRPGRSAPNGGAEGAPQSAPQTANGAAAGETAAQEAHLERQFEPAAGPDHGGVGEDVGARGQGMRGMGAREELSQRRPGGGFRIAPRPDGPSRVALLLPLSGPNGALGQAMLNAAQLALFDFADANFELLVQDTLGTPVGAANAAALAVSDGAQLILGPLLSASVRAVAPQAQAASINVIAFSSDRGAAGAGVYVMGFLPGAEIRRVVSYAHERGITRFAALAPDNVYGVTVVDALQEAVAALGASVTQVAFYDPNASDFSEVVRDLAHYRSRRSTLVAQRGQLEGRTDDIAQRALARLQGLETLGGVPFQALLLADGGERLQRIAALLPYYDIDPDKIKILGTGQWDVPGIGAEPAMVGGWYAAPAPGERADFEARYKKAYGAKPPRLATLAYDATALAAVLAQSGAEVRFGREAITSPSGYAGRDGIFRFRPQGTVERGLAVMEVHERNVEIISDPPVSFNVHGE